MEGDPLRSGARGAGLALEKGVTVEVCIGDDGVENYLNGVKGDYEVARRAAIEVARLAAYTGGFSIRQTVDVPIGGGLGTSGASALATVLATAALLGVKLSYTKLARIAHKVEVESGTGLGTVSGLVVGGACVVLEPGPPGSDRVDRIIVDQDHVVVVGFFGPIKKSSALRSASLADINRRGRLYVEALARDTTIENLLDFSKKFSLETGLATPNVRRAYAVLESKGFPHAGQAMVGDTVFTVLPSGEADSVATLLEEMGARAVTSRISWRPAVLLQA
ncbi:hypothetical protein IG193_02500 [Infirmifilum lucidum]|uniref:Pantoate kinase n=1 Tax=Infirmifilum lucidum TaxID=2776706 RepID=A0A7L9FJ41_9CREN|nr:hypothetical protein [Infirmifilum lucidum]QOJ79352.1 hypothetical protein IG193_02500 [Infirmifilum lucidum]